MTRFARVFKGLLVLPLIVGIASITFARATPSYGATSSDTLLPSNAIAGYQYLIAGGGGTPVSTTGVALSSAQFLNGVGAPASISMDKAGNIFLLQNGGPNGSQIDMIPNGSGTYFNISMTKGNVYRISGNGKQDGIFSGGPVIGIGGPALSSSGIGGISVCVDSSDNIFIGTGSVIYMIPSADGTFYGQAMKGGYVYQIVGNGVAGDSQNDVPATSAEFSSIRFTVSQSGNIFVSDLYNGVVDMVPATSGTYFGITMQSGYIYTIAGVNGSSNCTTTPSFGAAALGYVFCQPQYLGVDANGDLIINDNDGYTLMLPIASGTYYGKSMTPDQIYELVGNTYVPGNVITNGESASYRQNFVTVDGSGNLYFNDENQIGMMPETTGTYFGVSMTSNHVYSVAGPPIRNLFDPYLVSDNYAASLPRPWGDTIQIDPSGNIIYTSLFGTGTNFTYYIGAIANSGASTGSPTNPFAFSTSSTSSSVNLGWISGQDGGSAISDYKVTATPSGGGSATNFDTGSSALSYSTSSLTPGDTYTFSVTSTNANGTSSGSTSPPITLSSSIPSAPTSLKANEGGGSISLSWNAPSTSSSGVTDFMVSVYDLNGTSQIIDTHSQALSYTVSGLTPGDFYYLEVSALNSSGWGPTSYPVFSTVASPPSAPATPSASSITGGLEITWSPPLSNGGSSISGYELVVNPNGGSPTTISLGNVTSYNDTSLTVGTSYTFNVIAQNVAGNSPQSPPTPSVIDGIPSPPEPVGAEGGSGTIKVMWPTPSNNGASPITDYIVTEYPGSGTPVTIDMGSATNLLTLTGMDESTAYTFSVQAVNSYGNSALSTQSDPTTPSVVPGPPVNFWAVAGNGLQYGIVGSPNSGQLNVSGYDAYGCVASQGLSLYSPIMTAPTGATCQNNTPIYVTSQSANGNSAPTTFSVPVVEPSWSDVNMPPFICNDVSLTPVSGGMQFSFGNQNQDVAVNNYEVEVVPSLGPTTSVFENSSPFNITGLSSSTSYQFVIYCGNSFGWSLPYTTWDPSPLGPPFPPAAPIATAGNASVSLSWSAPNDGGSSITDYIITPSTGSLIDTHSTNTTYSVSNLTNGTPYTFSVQAVNANGDSGSSPASNQVTPEPPPIEYIPVTPLRIMDTRANSGYTGSSSTLSSGSTFSLDVAGLYGIPANATAISINVTVTNTTSSGYLSLYPDGTSLPSTSNLNWLSGETKANLVEISIGSDGKVDFFNKYGNTDVVVDLEGYFMPDSTSSGLYNALSPTRICDTRYSGNQCSGNTLGATKSLTLQVTGNNGVPSDAEAVVLNLTTTGTTTPGYLSISPNGTTSTSALNWNGPGETVCNRVIATLSTTGSIVIENAFGSADVIVDVTGYYTSSTSTSGGASFQGITPLRILDTRNASGYVDQGMTLPSGASLTLPISGLNNIPSGAKAVVINVTATNTTSPGYLSITPNGGNSTSDLNWMTAGQSVPNLDIATLSPTGSIVITNGSASSVDVVIDLMGYYS